MTEANWYADPEDPSRLRYWDGATWTEHTTPVPEAPTSAFDAAARGMRWRPDPASSDVVITVDPTDESAWQTVGSGAAATLRAFVGGLVAAFLVGAVWFGVNRFITDAGYRISGYLVSTLPAMMLGAVVGFFASDRREHPGWAASMWATLLTTISLTLATNGALAGYFDGPGGVFVSCAFGGLFAGVIAYGGRARAMSGGLRFLNAMACGFLALIVCALGFGTGVNPIGDRNVAPYEDCVLLHEFVSSVDDDSTRQRERTWNAFSTYVDDEMDGRVTSELKSLMAVQVLALAANPDDDTARKRLDELVERYDDRHDC